MNTPLLYNKVTPKIKRPKLAFVVFTLGFLIYSLAIILPYHYGIVVPKKESVIALSNFILIFIIYLLFTYDSYTGFKFPYFIQKHLIDPKLRDDLEHSKTTHMQYAYIVDLHQSSKSIYALLLQSPEQSEPEWYYVNLNLMFPKLYFFHLIKLENSCIGQEINIEYLPKSKVILKIHATEIENDFSIIDGAPFFCAVPKTLKRIPSQFLLDFLNITDITVQRLGNLSHYQFICKTSTNQTYYIPSTTKGFRQLELALSNKINWQNYNDFKCNPNQRSMNISI